MQYDLMQLLAAREGMAMIEFVCEGCGVNVFAFGITERPAHGMCATCAWLCEFIPDPEEMLKVKACMEAPP
jgi:hypothetical protein